jgi:filamentous hemagglutinin family protein
MISGITYSSRFKILKGGRISLIIGAIFSTITLSFASPSGGVVTSGSASIAHNGSTTNITQSSQKASINWTKFNIARDETVNFNQPNVNSITLNRVIGNERSIINGALNANGQVWILNSNGVLFGKNASVNTSGLLATTASLSDEAFQAGAYHFKNATSNSIINEGTIKVNNSSYVILASNETRNTGSIEAVKAKVHLVGANEYSINLNGNSLVDLTIEKGVMDALVENSGTIINEAGEIYLTTNAVDELLKGVVNHTGILEANSLDGITGKVELFAHGGEVQVGGTIKASEGFVETSGKDFKILDNATIEAGKWLIDPTNLTIDSALASSTQSQLKNGDVELEADEDITVSSNITWSSTRKLTLTAGDEIYVNATIKNTNNSNGGVYFNAANTQDKVIFGTNGKVIINNVYQLQWINQAVKGRYELGSNINASVTSTWNSDGSDGYYGWNPIGYRIYHEDGPYSYYDEKYFTGSFDGNGHVIDALYINRPSRDKPHASYVGLLGVVGSGGTVTNIGLTNVDITGYDTAGGLAGTNYGTIKNSYAAGSVSGDDGYVGGLVGDNYGKISNSYATGNVSGYSRIGGLVGENHYSGKISNSYATGSVSGNYVIGGLVGQNTEGTITNSYATGRVSAKDYRGGLVGSDAAGTVTNSYWDTDTSGRSTSHGGTGLTTKQFTDMSIFSTWDSSIWELNPGRGSTVEGYEALLRPYLKNVTQKSDQALTTLFASGWGTKTNPYKITTWKQLQNIDFNSKTLSYYYDLLNNLTTSTTGYINSGKGWDPIGYYKDDSDYKYFTGTFDGNGYVIDSLYINRPKRTDVGLFGDVGTNGTVINIGLTNVDIIGKKYVGSLVGNNREGTIKNSYATGNVHGNDYVGGLVAWNEGTITNSYTTGNVSGHNYVGGLVGENKGTISNVYSMGNVSVEEEKVGGLVAVNDGTIEHSYWDIDNSGQSSSAGGTGLTTDQFANSSHFSTWDSSVWQLGGGSSIEGYGLFSRPYLKDVTQESDKDVVVLFASGWGTEASPYTITTWAQLAHIDFTSDTLTNGYYYSLSSNLDSSTTGYSAYASSSANSGKGWNPIGSFTSKFRGSFEGNGYTIDSLYINRTSEYFIGLFGYVSFSATINNLGVTNANIIGKGGVGILTGINLGTVSNSYSTGNAHGEITVGGLFATNGGTISNAYSTAEVSGEENVGGLVGKNDGTISNAYSTGDVTGEEKVGGLVGYNYKGTITNSYATGSISGTSNVGGLVGYHYAGYDNEGTITKSYWDIDTSGQSSSAGGTGLTSAQMGYGKIFSDSSWNIEVDNTLTIGNAPLLRYNADGSATWIIAPLKLAYSLENQTLTYNGTQDLSSIYNSSSIFGSDYDFISSDDYTFTDSSDTSTSSVKNVGTYTAIGLKSKNSFLNIASTGNTKGTITINKKEITATYSADDKTYDGTTLANVNGSLVDAINGDSISLIQSANFEDKNAGSNKKINITNIALSGDDALNYTLTSPTTATTNANINKKEITATYSANDKIYDGTTLANVNGSLVDAISGDSISLIQSADFEDKNAGSNKQVNITNIALSGDDALNYTLTSQTTATTNANINKKGIKATYSASDKIYDGTTTATVSGSLGGIISGDKVSLLNQSANFEDKNAGSNKQVNITSIALSGDDALNYVVSDTTTNATINKKGITATYSAEDKTYDGTITATVSGSLGGGIISGDKVSLLNQSANFEDKNAGSNKQVNITNIALSGDDALNYVVSDTTTSATINKKGITATYSAEDKTYDGTTTATVNGSLSDVISGDNISLIQSANFEDKNPGDNKSVLVSGISLSGDDANNYILTSPTTLTTTASILYVMPINILYELTPKDDRLKAILTNKANKNHLAFSQQLITQILSAGINLPFITSSQKGNNK